MGHGTFFGEPETNWLTQDGTEDRNMGLLKKFSFKDPEPESGSPLPVP